ncbi:MAG TPA: hypothetical protein VGD53_35540 [Actinoallomurus sp.]
MNPQPGSPNPKTEPLPIPVWDVGEERPWNTPSERFAPSEADAMPPEPGPAAQDFDAPAVHPRPLEYDPATQNLTPPPAGSMPLEDHRTRWDLGARGTDSMPSGHDPATQNLGAPVTGPIPPFEHDPAGWNQGVPPFAGQTVADGRTGKSRKMPLLAGGVAVAAVLVGGLVYALTQGLPGSGQNTHTAGAKPDAARQAAAANQVLKSGKVARGHLPSRMRTCDDVAAGVPGFRQVVRDRQQELSQSKGLKVDGLRDGSRLRRSMIAAYQSSLDADQAYLAWAQEVQGRNCGGKTAPRTAHYRDAISANGKAGPAKRQVVTLWKPIASSHGLPIYAWNRL